MIRFTALPRPLRACMLTRRRVIAAVACAVLATAAPAWPVEASALAFVTDIYNGYKGNDSPGHALDSETVIRRYSSRRWRR